MFGWYFGFFTLGSKAFLFLQEAHFIFHTLEHHNLCTGLASFQNLGSVRKNKAYNPSSELIFIAAR
jgi:hypothetical protein